jgi:HEAT repeat protein
LLEDDYVFDESDLHAHDANLRGWAVMAISKEKLSAYRDTLLGMLGEETDVDVRRHIVRALGNIGDDDCIPALLRILSDEQGLIVGDAAGSLGKLRAVEAVGRLKKLANSDTEWVANQSRWALKQMPGNA